MGHVVPSGTGFTADRLRRGFESMDELYMGRTSDTGAKFLSFDEDEEESVLADVENIIQGVTGYTAESQESEDRSEESR